MNFPCRVTRLAIDPTSPDEIYAGLEVDGVLRSRDRGETWEDIGDDLVKLAERPHLKSRIASDTENEGMLDTHALTVSSALPGTVFLAVRMGLFRSADRGQTWQDMEIGRFSPLTYARDVVVSPHNPRTLVAALSPAARSTDGSLYRSDDLGQTWRRIDHGIKAESTMMAVSLHPRDPEQVYSVARLGQVFGTRDGGKTWKEWRLPPGSRTSTPSPAPEGAAPGSRQAGVNIGTGGPPSVGLKTTFTRWPIRDRVESQSTMLVIIVDALVERHVGDARTAPAARRITL